MPSQHALLILRTCLLPRLRHLLRTISPEGTQDVWTRLDDAVKAAVTALRWAPGRTESDEIDHTLISLPIRLGGLGLLSYADTRQHAAEAAAELSNTVLATLTDAIPAPLTTKSQRDRCAEMFLEQREKMMEDLTVPERMTIVENASAVGRRWLSVIPTQPQACLNDFEMALALRHRTLSPPQTDRCRMCGHQQPDMFHAESCRHTQGDRQRRHEVVKYALGRALARTPGSSVIYEPIVIERAPSQARYNDVRYSGSIECGLRPMEFDVKVLGLGTTNHGLGRPLPPSTTGYIEQARQRAAEGLKKLAEHTARDLPENIVLVPGSTFHPFVLSAGGLAEGGTTKVLDELKQQLPPGAFSFMTQVISIGLQRRRVEAMMRVEGGGAVADERRGVRRGGRD